MTPWQILSFNPTLLRALEISLVGSTNHSTPLPLRVLGHPDNGSQAFRDLSRSLLCPESREVWVWTSLCGCGWLGDPSHACYCSPRLVFRLRRRFLATRHHLEIECPTPRARELVYRERCEQIEMMLERVREAQERLVGVDAKICGPSATLLGQAGDRLGFTVRQREMVADVARAIAALAWSSEIRQSHVAEAVMYQSSIRQVDQDQIKEGSQP